MVSGYGGSMLTVTQTTLPPPDKTHTHTPSPEALFSSQKLGVEEHGLKRGAEFGYGSRACGPTRVLCDVHC
eukprot:733761-Rhodomonas_salina.1